MIELGIVLIKYVTIPILVIAGIGYLCYWLVERKKPVGEVEIKIKHNQAYVYKCIECGKEIIDWRDGVPCPKCGGYTKVIREKQEQ